MKRIFSSLMLTIACLAFGFAVTSCGSDNNEPPQEPTDSDFSIEFGQYIVGGSSTNNNGHISGTESIVVKPQIVGINTVLVNLGPKIKKGPNTEVGEYKVLLIPILDSKSTEAGRKIENLKFEYNGKTISGHLNIPWGSDEDGRTFQVTMSFDIVGGTNTKPNHNSFDLSVVVTRGE